MTSMNLLTTLSPSRSRVIYPSLALALILVGSGVVRAESAPQAAGPGAATVAPTLPHQDFPSLPLPTSVSYLSPALVSSTHWKTETVARPKVTSVVDNSPEFLMLRGEYRVGGISLTTEMGDLRISHSANTVSDISRRGARFALQSGNAFTTARLETFAGTTVSSSGTDGVLVGATGELSMPSARARLKTVLLSGRESLNPSRGAAQGEKRGEVLGVVAAVEPFPGRLAAEAEADFSRHGLATPAQGSSVGDMAYRVKVGGELEQHYRYSAVYERTGPQYRAIAGDGPQRDSEGVSVKMGADFPIHAVDINLSRYNDNLAVSDLYPRSYRYEGRMDYSYKGIPSLPLRLQYRKSLLSGVREPDGVVVRDAETDSVTGRANYLVSRWDLGARWSFEQRSDRLNDATEMISTTVAFSPKFRSGNLAIAPDLSLSRSRDFLAGVDRDKTAVALDVRGRLLERVVKYDLKGGYSREQTTGLPTPTETIGVKLKLGCDLMKILPNPVFTTAGFKGEYNRTVSADPVNGINNYALLFLLDSGRTFF